MGQCIQQQQRLQRHSPRWMLRRHNFPFIVVLGTTAATTFFTTLSMRWCNTVSFVDVVHSIPTTAIAFTITTSISHTASRRSRCICSWGCNDFNCRNIHLSWCDSRHNKLFNINKSQIRRYANSSLNAIPNVNIEGELWESNNDNDITDLDETFTASLEDEDDDDDDDENNILDEENDTDFTESTDNDSDNNIDQLSVQYERWSNAVNKAIVGLETKLHSLRKEFVKAEQLETLQSRGQYLQSYRHLFTSNQVQSVTVQDWDTGEDNILTLDESYDCVGDEIDAIFIETKKLKRGKKTVGTLIEQTIKVIDSMKEMRNDLDEIITSSSTDSSTSNIDNMFRLIQDRLKASSRETNFKPPIDTVNDMDGTNRKLSNTKKVSKPVLGTPLSNIRKVISPAGCTILVGRNRVGNEYLSLNLAKKHDIWMHARDIPGAHVLVVQRRGSGIYATDDCFQLAANLAAFYSDGRSERTVLVSAAEPKHILKPRGAPLGAIKLREELRVYKGYPNDVPDELKEARAISGLADEYRIKDKSKLRKQNKQQVAERKENTKQKIKEKREQRNQEEADKFY
jgi:predicted ribosome quality control (RQC) complex YloA/Tae2 family protein